MEIKRCDPPTRNVGGGSSSSKSVFVSNLPTDASIVTSDVLRDAFVHCGSIANVVRMHAGVFLLRLQAAAICFYL